jgi:hypothetical protein
VVLNPGERLNLNIYAKKSSSGCNGAVAKFSVKYSLKSERKEENKSLEYTFRVASSSSRPSSSSSSSSVGSSSSSSSSSDENLSEKIAKCEESGGVWLEHFCYYSSSSSSADSSSSLSERDTDSSASPTLTLEDKVQRAYEVASELENKSYGITGYFIYYGDPANYEPFKWIYANKSFSLVSKLEGAKPDGGFRWTRLMSNRYNIHVFESVSMDENGTVHFGALNEPLPGKQDVHEETGNESDGTESSSSSSTGSSSSEASSDSSVSSEASSSSSEASSSSSASSQSSDDASSEESGSSSSGLETPPSLPNLQSS